MNFYVRGKSGRIKVILTNDGEKVFVPRKLTKHLDGPASYERDANIAAWIDEYERVQGIERQIRAEVTDQKLLGYVERYCMYIEGRNESPKTVRQHKSCLLYHVIPLLTAGDPPTLSPNQWPDKAPRQLAHLEGKGVGGPTIRVCNIALRHFWTYLQDEGLILASLAIRLRPPLISRKPTPLQRTVGPDDILAWAKACKSEQVKLMGLLGYFFSLRLQETFALKPSDFRAGKLSLAWTAARPWRS